MSLWSEMWMQASVQIFSLDESRWDYMITCSINNNWWSDESYITGSPDNHNVFHRNKIFLRDWIIQWTDCYKWYRCLLWQMIDTKTKREGIATVRVSIEACNHIISQRFVMDNVENIECCLGKAFSPSSHPRRISLRLAVITKLPSRSR